MAMSPSERLIRHGFIRPKAREFYQYDEKKQVWAPKKGGYDAKHASEEEDEEVNIQAAMEKSFTNYIRTGYPEPAKRYRILFESFGASIEETYYWLLTHFQQDLSFSQAHKIVDIYSASENSAFFGTSNQRLAIQQDRVSQFLATIGKMVKDLFQLVRELRIIDERLEPYEQWEAHKSADVTLKGLFIDLVEGGTKNPGSVLGLAGQVGFVPLPDLFFNTHIFKLEDLDSKVDPLPYNVQLKNILKRKLYQYINWKITTERELRTRRRFTLKYLWQHWEVIQLYMSWIKPNLRHIKKLSMNQGQMDSVELVTAFETSMTEIEILLAKPSQHKYKPVVVATFTYRTRPSLSYQTEGYQRGPIHVGRVIFNLRAYGWTDKEIEAYKELRRGEELELLGMVDGSVQAAMEALGEELQKYLREAQGKEEEPKKEETLIKVKGPSAAEPFSSVFLGLWEIFTLLIPVKEFRRPKRDREDPGARGEAGKSAAGAIWQAFKNYKKSHGMLSW